MKQNYSPDSREEAEKFGGFDISRKQSKSISQQEDEKKYPQDRPKKFDKKPNKKPVAKQTPSLEQLSELEKLSLQLRNCGIISQDGPNNQYQPEKSIPPPIGLDPPIRQKQEDEYAEILKHFQDDDQKLDEQQRKKKNKNKKKNKKPNPKEFDHINNPPDFSSAFGLDPLANIPVKVGQTKQTSGNQYPGFGGSMMGFNGFVGPILGSIGLGGPQLNGMGPGNFGGPQLMGGPQFGQLGPQYGSQLGPQIGLQLGPVLGGPSIYPGGTLPPPPGIGLPNRQFGHNPIPISPLIGGPILGGPMLDFNQPFNNFMEQEEQFKQKNQNKRNNRPVVTPNPNFPNLSQFQHPNQQQENELDADQQMELVMRLIEKSQSEQQEQQPPPVVKPKKQIKLLSNRKLNIAAKPFEPTFN
ncbi:hypothetical protein pb186bvf_005702 [Paramecium bursaria]